ncbi:MAG: DUF1569 domain-containing protein [Bacteroidia bacterium]|nr:DUF1569 domain-containing protein [Bacteroidia bacterium]
MKREPFLKQEVPSLLGKLTSETRALWGQMSAQHMVEHLGLVISLSNGKLAIPCQRSAEKIAISQAFLMSEQPFPKEFRAPMLPPEPLPLVYPDLSTAIEGLQTELSRFWQAFSTQPYPQYVHPVFGNLTFEQWKQFHCKHFIHHFSQFGLLPEYSTLTLEE